MKPFVKWVGGKRQLLPVLKERLPSLNCYFEPFVGGGALLFELKPKKAVIGDINPHLINAYQVIKNDVDRLVSSLKLHKFDKEYYLETRRNVPEDRVEQASRFIFLNRMCFNGLYRENSKGEFNAAFGRFRRNPEICNEENLREISEYLNQSDIQILNGSYRDTIRAAKEGDMVYFDPPYHVMTKTSFTRYNKENFGEKSQHDLRDTFFALKDQGVNVMLSNSDTPLINDLYKDANVVKVSARRVINRNLEARGKSSNEVVIRTY